MAWQPPADDEVVQPIHAGKTPVWTPPDSDQPVAAPAPPPDLAAAGIKSLSTADVVPPPLPKGTAATVADYLKRLYSATKETLTPPTSPDAAGRMLSPSAGKFGMGRFLEEEGKRVGGAVRGAAKNAAEKFVELPGINQFPEAATGAAAVGESVADLASDSLTPSSFQQQLGAEGLPMAGKVLKGGAAEALTDVAQTAGAKSLGFTKRLLKTPAAQAAARGTAQEMLDQGVITPLASGEEMAGRVQDLLEKSGGDIGSFLKSRNGGFDTQSAVDAMEALRPHGAGGDILKGGAYDAVNSQIDQAIQTVKAHGDTIPFEEANKLKGFLQDLVNWNSTKAEGAVGRGVAGAMREAVDTSLEKAGQEGGGAPPGEFEKFLADKKTYKAGMQAQDALANRLSSEFGNKTIGLTDTILGAGELAAGNPVGAAAAVGGKKLLERYGTQTVASGADWLAKAISTAPEQFGAYSTVLRAAAARGPQALATTDYVMQQRDPQYRLLKTKMQPGSNP